MPQKEINTAYYRIDPVTGYLESKKERLKFNASTKAKFLQVYEQRNDVDEACRLAGISRRILAPHLRADEKFRKDFLSLKQRLHDTDFQRKKEVLARLWKSANK